MRHLLLSVLICAVTACGSPDSADKEKPAELPQTTFQGASVTSAAAKIDHGERLTWVLGCRGCHGKAFQGHVWVDSPEEGLLHASNLTRALPDYTDAQLRKLLVSGEHPSGRAVWEMPSELFHHLSDRDIDALIAHLRTVKPAGEPSPSPRLGPIAEEMVKKGELKPVADRVRESRRLAPIELGPQHALGRYIARATCAECHGMRLDGDDSNPDLIVVGAYSREEFEKLLTEGEPNGPRKLDLMARVATERFARLTREERDALYAYLIARAEQPQ